MTAGLAACRACGSPRTRPLVALADLPVHCNLLYPTREAALAAPLGDLELSFCDVCGHVGNAAFDAALTAYDGDYEASLAGSALFRDYVDDQIEGLVRRHDLSGRRILEIGCGQGDFLGALCRRAGASGIGFDPCLKSPGDDGRVRLVADFFTADRLDVPVDLVCCRQVLEHVENPATLLREIRRALDGRPGAAVFFEVPNSLYTLRDLGIWDLIYEHCSYFSMPSLCRLFESCGFAVTSVFESYGGQFLCIEATPAAAPASAWAEPAGTHAPLDGGLVTLADGFGEACRAKLAGWRARLDDCAAAGRRVAVWGAGSKGVTFLNLVDRDRTVVCAVDVNPRKQGMHVAGTGQPIVAPDRIAELRPDLVLLMNPFYRDEIAAELARRGLTPDVDIV